MTSLGMIETSYKKTRKRKRLHERKRRDSTNRIVSQCLSEQANDCLIVRTNDWSEREIERNDANDTNERANERNRGTKERTNAPHARTPAHPHERTKGEINERSNARTNEPEGVN